MAFSINKVESPDKAHSISEFIQTGANINQFYSYTDFSFIQNLDNTQYIIKNVLDDYIEEMKERSVEIALTNLEKEKYKYNPKSLSYKLYKTTMLYWVILRLNDMCNIHEFNLIKKKILLLKPKDMSDILTKIYNSEKRSISEYNSIHKNDKSIIPETIKQ